MSIGFILVSVEPGYERVVYNLLSKVNGISELHQLFGEYDIIVKIEANDFYEIGDIILGKIRTIKGVIETKTLNATPILE